MIAEVIAEAAGTAVFLSVLLMYGVSPIAISIGLLAAIYAFGKVSGGHFNPAISFLMYVKGDIDFAKSVIYVIAQLIGALLALLWWKYTMGSKKAGSSILSI